MEIVGSPFACEVYDIRQVRCSKFIRGAVGKPYEIEGGVQSTHLFMKFSFIRFCFYKTYHYFVYCCSSSISGLFDLKDAISPVLEFHLWRQNVVESTLARVMACCLTAPSHYLNQCWLIISKVLWQFIGGHYHEKIWRYQAVKQDSIFRITFRFPIGQWVRKAEFFHTRLKTLKWGKWVNGFYSLLNKNEYHSLLQWMPLWLE